MRSFAFSIALAGALASGTARADVVLSSSLANLNNLFATTTTNADGRTTTGSTVIRASASAGTDVWYQANVGGNGTVGITTAFPENGNGSAYFATTGSSSKADLQYVLAAPVLLSSLTAASYDFYRSDTSTTTNTFAPVFRLDIAKNGTSAGSLVFENVYQTQSAAPVDSWTTLSATLNSGIFWATKPTLGTPSAGANGGQQTLQQWIEGNAGATLTVTGMSIGVGSGWTGTFRGGVDDVSFAFADGPQSSFNFEVAGLSAVPEPATLALTLTGVGALGLLRRRRA